ncbi:hypothetical protein B7494_g3877 [Chlorociboria aeruginascens]|nr:hypothetical protein B7494_g3877 [Chlorociboria aeruginascens]
MFQTMDAISAAETASAASYTRLHITPFNPDLLTTILPLSVLPHAQNISYHSLQTFPDKAYGFVDLPTMDAEKLKKKLHGSILKGAKVKIEKAREPVDLSFTAGEEEPKKVKKRKDLIKKRKRYDETIPAVEIGERSVKRGWTTPTAVIAKGRKEGKEKKVVLKSKYTTGPECLFKMVLPPNMASNSKSDKKGKEALLHEFSNTTKYATFLRGAAGIGKSKAVKEFVEGKGWVDEDGNVVEVVVKRVRKPGTQKMVITQEDGSNSDTPKESLSEEGVNYGLVKEVISRKSFSPEKGAPADETSEDLDTSLDSSLEYSDSDNSEPSIPAVSIAEDSKTSTSGSSSESDFESSDNESTQPTPQPVPIFKTPLKPPILTTTSVRPPSSSGPVPHSP